MSEQAEFHAAWGLAKDHPELHAEGYDKQAFQHVQHWMNLLGRCPKGYFKICGKCFPPDTVLVDRAGRHYKVVAA